MLSTGSQIQSGNLGDQESRGRLQPRQVSKTEAVVVPIGKKSIVMENSIMIKGYISQVQAGFQMLTSGKSIKK